MAEGLTISELPKIPLSLAAKLNAHVPVAYEKAATDRNGKIAVADIEKFVAETVSNALNGVAESKDLQRLESGVNSNSNEIKNLWQNFGKPSEDGGMEFMLEATDNLDVATSTPAVSAAPLGTILQTIWNKIRSVANALAVKQDKLTAGSNITISGSTISASASGGTTLNRTIGANTSTTNATVTDTGGNIAVPVRITTEAASPTTEQQAAVSNGSLRAVIQRLIDNVAIFLSYQRGFYTGNSAAPLLKRHHVIEFIINSNNRKLWLDSRVYPVGVMLTVCIRSSSTSIAYSGGHIVSVNAAGSDETILSGISTSNSECNKFVAVFVKDFENFRFLYSHGIYI